MMSSMWRVAYLVPIALAGDRRGSRRNMRQAYPAPARTAQPRLHRPRRLCAQRLAPLRAVSGYPFADYARFLIANPGWPDEDEAAPLGRSGDAARRECPDRARLLRHRQAAESAMAGPGWPKLMPPAAEPPRRSTAARKAWGSADLSAADEQAIWARYGASLHHAPTTTSAPMPCCSTRRPSDAARFVAHDQPAAPGRLCRAGRDAERRRRRRSALRRGDRPGDQRRRPDDGPRPLPSRQQLRRRARASSPPARTISSIARPTSSASMKCCCSSPSEARRAPRLSDRLQYRPPGR